MSLPKGVRPWFDTYEAYLQTIWWKRLKKKLITANPHARCFVCENKFSLLLHHITYEHLMNERLGRDIYILCYTCHTNAHFYKVLGIITRRVPMNRKSLVMRLYYLRCRHLLENKRILLGCWYTLRYFFLALSL